MSKSQDKRLAIQREPRDPICPKHGEGYGTPCYLCVDEENQTLRAAMDAVHDALGESRDSDDATAAEGVAEWIAAAKGRDAECDALRELSYYLAERCRTRIAKAESQATALRDAFWSHAPGVICGRCGRTYRKCPACLCVGHNHETMGSDPAVDPCVDRPIVHADGCVLADTATAAAARDAEVARRARQEADAEIERYGAALRKGQEVVDQWAARAQKAESAYRDVSKAMLGVETKAIARTLTEIERDATWTPDQVEAGRRTIKVLRAFISHYGRELERKHAAARPPETKPRNESEEIDAAERLLVDMNQRPPETKEPTE